MLSQTFATRRYSLVRQVGDKTKYLENAANHVKTLNVEINIDTVPIQDVQIVANVLYDFYMIRSFKLYSDRFSMTQFNKFLDSLDKTELYSNLEHISKINFKNCLKSSFDPKNDIGSQKRNGTETSMMSTTTKETTTRVNTLKTDNDTDFDFSSVSQNPRNNYYLFVKMNHLLQKTKNLTTITLIDLKLAERSW
jgi:hypothetical protein